MTADQPKQNSLSQAPLHVLPANIALTDSLSREPALVNLFSELTGENDSQARSAFMFVIREDLRKEASHEPAFQARSDG